MNIWATFKKFFKCPLRIKYINQENYARFVTCDIAKNFCFCQHENVKNISKWTEI